MQSLVKQPTQSKRAMLFREKEIISVDGEAGGTEEFVVMDIISVRAKKFVLMVEAKRSSMGNAMKQVLLAMKDSRDANGEGSIYGFMTMGDDWQMAIHDGSTFK
ncbi:hypothetical protein BDZ91DRAFT_846885 [Kalaharituber pfeilii]|nr:hypothetical protein BDZ91DRAFT_846885 [Kalaharituber pfeilii]